MTITERLFDIANKKGIRQTELANALGIKAQLVNNWKTRGTTPPMEYLPTICDTLGISWEYLVTGEDTTTTPRLTAEENHLLKNYRKTSDKGRGRIQECAREMVQLYPDLPNDTLGILKVLGERNFTKGDIITDPRTGEKVEIVGYAIAGTGMKKPDIDVAKHIVHPKDEE